MSPTNSKIEAINEQLIKGVAPPQESVRSLLIWFNSSRRGLRVCKEIRVSLKFYGLKTNPDFEFAYIDSQISFIRDEECSENEIGFSAVATDPTHRIGRLKAANQPPVTINSESSLEEGVTLLLTHDFSQIPVMTNERDLKGIISWKTIGSMLSLKKRCSKVKECMDTAQEIGIDESFFSAISIIASHDYVIVRGNDRRVSGIVTASDFNIQFRKLAEPFLLVGEIEMGVRHLLHGKFTKAELLAAKAPDNNDREIEGVASLTFGEYSRLIEPADNWKKLKIAIDRVQFIKFLDRIRMIRNDVMHFDPDGLDDCDLQTLREFAKFLKRLRDLKVV